MNPVTCGLFLKKGKKTLLYLIAPLSIPYSKFKQNYNFAFNSLSLDASKLDRVVTES